MKGPWSTWGLRGTVTASFALGALIVSTLFAVGTYLTARHYLMDQRQATALRQAYADASFVLDGLLGRDARIPDVLTSVKPAADSELIVRKDDRWYSSSLARGPQSIPAEVQGGVVDAREAYRRSTDRPGFLAALKRNGVDTSFVERLA